MSTPCIHYDGPADVHLPTGLYGIVRLLRTKSGGWLASSGVFPRVALTSRGRVNTFVAGSTECATLPLEIASRFSGA